MDLESLEMTARQKDRLGRSSIDHKVYKFSPSEGERLQFHSETIERERFESREVSLCMGMVPQCLDGIASSLVLLVLRVFQHKISRSRDFLLGADCVKLYMNCAS